MTEVLKENYNFSKIGKYISNKLHHIHKPKKDQPKALPSAPSAAPTKEDSERSANKENKRRRIEWN